MTIDDNLFILRIIMTDTFEDIQKLNASLRCSSSGGKQPAFFSKRSPHVIPVARVNHHLESMARHSRKIIKLTFGLCLSNMTLCPWSSNHINTPGDEQKEYSYCNKWGYYGYKKTRRGGFFYVAQITLQQLLLSLNDQPARCKPRRVVACTEATLQNTSVTTGRLAKRGPSSLNSFATISLSRYGRMPDDD